MGSLYDMGNFRYKHFTFYSCPSQTSTSGSDNHQHSVTGCSPPDTPTEDDDKQIINFLDRVWPYDALIMGQSAENDRAFVTYVKQEADFSLNVENIYVFIRKRPSSEAPPLWIRELTPVTSLNPTDYEE